MTIEERDTMRAIQTIAKEMKAQRQPQPIDWEQRRYEIARDMLAAFLSNSCSNVYAGTYKSQAKNAVLYADALIEELQKKK